ncbi:hypothetical protein DUI87_13099 [Hirundo rustica rustica]|uniref:Uncharacterized protein n=1 Tax=Hirundo rustica rustica TaxID=333673 RepID=A0A3M0KT29_HIRRU|nr:hypothetical protein DUI87_13099 [Hirundo rustica rustica]
MAQCPDGGSDNAVSQRSVLGLVLFSILINDIEGSKCTLGSVADDSKLSSAVDTHEGWDAMQRDMDWCNKWAHEKDLKGKVLHLSQGNPSVSIKAEE